MVTALDMRLFASDCLRWSAETSNATHRDLMLRIAKTWIATASSVERRPGNHALEVWSSPAAAAATQTAPIKS